MSGSGAARGGAARTARNPSRLVRRSHRSHRPARRPRLRLGRGSGSARAPLRDAAQRTRERGVLRELLRPERELQSARHRPRTRRDEPRASRAIGASSISRCACPTGPSRSSKAAPNGGAPGALPVCSWSTTGCVAASSAARARSCCRRGTAHPSSDWHCIAPGFDPRRMAAVARESRRWNVLLAQNPYAARILGKAYAFLTRPVWVEGYPRNDVLTTGDASETRRALGIRPERPRAPLRADVARRSVRDGRLRRSGGARRGHGFRRARAGSLSHAPGGTGCVGPAGHRRDGLPRTRRSCCSRPTCSSRTIRRSCSTSA